MKTAAFVAGELRKLGYAVTEHVGKYEDGTQAEGVVAVMENGKGPRVMPLLSPHSALFAPVYAPAITTGVTAMTAVALDLLH